ncbi:unnamed protein product [Brugia timori]|uniref:Uncharacterized protein n=1 Tax=Brugia timori TaxID=42155 RepID=A0A0R3QGB4_9BILA|nr:unnamed protein product [Brugia timori]
MIHANSSSLFFPCIYYCPISYHKLISTKLIMPLTGLDLAVYGFNRNTRKIEEAGISYELRIIRDKLTLGVNTEPILKQSPSIERFTGNWTNLGCAEGNRNYVSIFTLRREFNPKILT